MKNASTIQARPLDGAEIEQAARTAYTANSATRGKITMTLDEAADELRVSRRFLQTEAKRGKLRVIRLSAKCTRVRASDFAEYLEAGATR